MNNSISSSSIQKSTGLGFLKTSIYVVLVSIFLVFVSGLLSTFLFWTIGTMSLGFPLNTIVALLLLPFGFDVILLTPLLWLLTRGFFNFYKTPASVSKIWFITFSIIAMVIFLRVGMFRMTSILGENYIEHRVNTVMTQRDEIVGTEPAEITYSETQPIYASNNRLESLQVTLKVKLPKNGDYQIDANLVAENVRPESQVKPHEYIPGRLKFSYETFPSEQEITLDFDAAELHQYNYDGPLAFSVYNIWRINIEIDAAFGGGTSDTATVDILNRDDFMIGSYPLQL